MANTNLDNATNALLESLRNCRTEILAKGGSIASDAGFSAIPNAIKSLPSGGSGTPNLTLSSVIDGGDVVRWGTLADADKYEIFRYGNVVSPFATVTSGNTCDISSLPFGSHYMRAGKGSLYGPFVQFKKSQVRTDSIRFALGGPLYYSNNPSNMHLPNAFEVSYGPESHAGFTEIQTIPFDHDLNDRMTDASISGSSTSSLVSFSFDPTWDIDEVVSGQYDSATYYQRRMFGTGRFTLFKNGYYKIIGKYNDSSAYQTENFPNGVTITVQNGVITSVYTGL